MLISVLLPSYRRLNMLTRCMESVAKTAKNTNDVEILLHLRRGDTETLPALDRLLYMAPHVKAIIGPPLDGWKCVGLFCHELAKIARGKWLWFLYDDWVIMSGGWQQAVEQHQGEPVTLLPEKNQLNTSLYDKDGACPSMLVPAAALNMEKPWPDPIDTYVFGYKYPKVFMPGVHFWHDQPSPEQWKKNRDAEKVREDADKSKFPGASLSVENAWE